MALLLRTLREAGAQDQATALMDRDPAARVSLDDPRDVGFLLHELQEAGAHDQAAALAGRAAAHAALDDPYGAAELRGVERRELRKAGAQDEATALTARLPAAGLFGLFLKQQGRQDRFRFGREADGSPSAP